MFGELIVVVDYDGGVRILLDCEVGMVVVGVVEVACAEAFD